MLFHKGNQKLLHLLEAMEFAYFLILHKRTQKHEKQLELCLKSQNV